MSQVPLPPLWEVTWPFAGTHVQLIRADTAALAAEIYCEVLDAPLHGNGIAIAGEARLSVTRDGITVQVDVVAETKPRYSGREVRQ